MPRQRADVALTARGFFPSRAKAAEAIAAGLVAANGKRVAKASEPLDPGATIAADAPYPWVSRGGVKLAAALDHFGIDPLGQNCLDVGASTGGFTDVLLARGARRITAVDVGRGQLHPSIAANPRVASRERCDARGLRASDLREAPSLIVADVSFISLTLVLPHVLALAAPTATLVALVKPQFEGAKNKGGIVRDDDERLAALARVVAAIETAGWLAIANFASPITGGDGNTEYLLHARRTA